MTSYDFLLLLLLSVCVFQNKHVLFFVHSLGAQCKNGPTREGAALP